MVPMIRMVPFGVRGPFPPSRRVTETAILNASMYVACTAAITFLTSPLTHDSCLATPDKN